MHLTLVFQRTPNGPFVGIKSAMQSSLQAFVAKQLGHPSGFCGRLLLRLLNRENAGMHQLAFEQLAIRQGDRILEIGFGGGSLLARILQTGLPERVVGVDYAEDALKVAQKKTTTIYPVWPTIPSARQCQPSFLS